MRAFLITSAILVTSGSVAFAVPSKPEEQYSRGFQQAKRVAAVETPARGFLLSKMVVKNVKALAYKKTANAESQN